MAASTFLADYAAAAAEREALGVPALPLSAELTAALTELLTAPPAGKESFLLDLLSERIPPGVDEAAYVKASWLLAVAKAEATSPLVSPVEAVHLLATMIGGYNVGALIELLSSADPAIAEAAAEGLSTTLLVYDAYNDVLELAESNSYAKRVIDSWAAAEWFTAKPELPAEITVTVFKVEGETNTDDLSPATHATTRPDIPLHAQAMLETRMPGGLELITELKKGPPRGLCRRCGGHGQLAQISDQLGALAHRQRHPPRAQQAQRRRDPGGQDRADLFQHGRGFRRPADRVRRERPQQRRRDHDPPLRRHDRARRR
jgi:aconitate hydratase 2 / 2-methylisocitrate dehydratase